jgi:hypothetical protein
MVAGKIEVHKLILLGPVDVIDSLRPEAEALFRSRASLTVAIPGMLEVCTQAT